MFTSRDIKRLTEAANLPEFEDKNILYPLLSKAERKDIIKSNENLLNRCIAAAVEIQRIWRGYRIRKLIYSLVGSGSNSFCGSPSTEDVVASTKRLKIASESNFFYRPLSSKNLLETVISTKISPNDSSVISTKKLSNENSMLQNTSQLKFNDELEDEIFQNDISSEEYKLLSFQSFCAYVIQKWWREKISRRKAFEKEALHTAEKEAIRAAQVIQKTWRAYVDLRVFGYLKDLIDFRNKGDGRFMMKFINPKEAALIDSSIGMHVRFRFGGVTFPPCIYYKIFTNNVADVCSFSPRNYKDYFSSPIPGKFIHSRQMELIPNSCHEGWYRRFENNGWRPVVDNILLSLKQNEILQEKSCQKFVFSHKKVTRKEEAAVKRKKKRIEWMKKLYMMGVLKQKCESHIDQHKNKEDEKEDWEVDNLLQWTAALDFESYVEDWHFYGTSFIQENLFDSYNDPS